MEKEISPTLVTYREMIREAGRQLGLRKKTLAWRSLFIIWPTMIAFILLFYFAKLGGKEFLQTHPDYTIPAVIGFFVWIFFAIFYYVIITSIFAVEKRIWLDSFFDQKNINPKDSWHIAKKLFWAVFSVCLKMLLRFYLLPFLFYIIFITAFIYFGANLSQQIPPVASISIVSGGLLALIIYFYYLKIKLRFLWFIFLDYYKTENFSHSFIFQEMKKLNEISKSETFKKSLVINLAADSLQAITNAMIEELQTGLSALGKGGELTGGLIRAYTEEASKQAISLGKIAAIYVLYRFAQQQLNGRPQVINENIYNLLKV
jgi:hypothetical protein